MPDQSIVSAQHTAETLVQALPHMLRYDDAIVVVKYGGHAMGDEAVRAGFRPRYGAA